MCVQQWPHGWLALPGAPELPRVCPACPCDAWRCLLPAPARPLSRALPAVTLPLNVIYIGCFRDNSSSRALPLALTAAISSTGDRANSVNGCLALAASATARNSTQRIVFMGLQRFQCYGGESLLRALKMGQLAETACTSACPGVPAQRCGGMPFASDASTAPISIYRIVT